MNHNGRVEKNRRKHNENMKKIVCYKFRGIRTDCRYMMNEDIKRIEEILKGELYCSDWRKQNDIVEGCYYYKDNLEKEKLYFGEKCLTEQKEAYNICSLTRSLNNPLMWAFYASNNSGVAIEIKLPKSEVEEVLYHKMIPIIDLKDISDDTSGCKTRMAARQILTNKLNIWKYEKEVRILTCDERYKIDKPTRIYYGSRMEKSVLDKLLKLCGSLGSNIEIKSIAEFAAPNL